MTSPAQAFGEKACRANPEQAAAIGGQPGAERYGRKQGPELKASRGRSVGGGHHLPNTGAALAETCHAVALIGEFGRRQAGSIRGARESGVKHEGRFGIQRGLPTQRCSECGLVLGKHLELRGKEARGLREQAVELERGCGLLNELKEHSESRIPLLLQPSRGLTSIVAPLASALRGRAAKVPRWKLWQVPVSRFASRRSNRCAWCTSSPQSWAR